MSQWKTTSMEDDLKGRRPQWNTPQWKMTSMEDDLNGRWSPRKMTPKNLKLDCLFQTYVMGPSQNRKKIQKRITSYLWNIITNYTQSIWNEDSHFISWVIIFKCFRLWSLKVFNIFYSHLHLQCWSVKVYNFYD